jgi:hypothetical protein
MQEKYRFKIFSLSNIFLSALLYSNSLVVAQQNNKLIDENYKNGVLQKVDSLLITKYVLSEKAIEYSEIFKKSYESGNYKSYTNSNEFAEQITSDLIQISGDKHLKFRVIESTSAGEKSESALHHPVRYHILGINENKGFSKLEWIKGNIGYLDIRRFNYFSDTKDLIIAAMKFLSKANAIIIDLRENAGGSGDYLSSYFLPYPTQLNSWYSREDDFLTEYWTAKEIGVERLTEVPLFLITSRRTFSAAESFAYDMQVRKRAIIIGDSTKGGAHSVDLYKINDQFEIYIPTARAINPITNTNWEGVGVVPDIIIPADYALDTTIVLARKAAAEFARTREAKLKLAVEEMQIHLNRAEILFLENKKDNAGRELDLFFQTADNNDLINEFFIDVLAYNYLSPRDENILYSILKKKIEYFPKSPAAYETLAYAYYKNNKKELAISCFESVLKLEPENRNAIKMIKRLRNE